MSIVVKIIEGPFPFLLLIWLIHFTYYLSNLSFDPRPQTCEYGSKCPKAHSMEELQEWMMRAAEEEEIRHNIQAQGLMSYNDMLLEEYKNSSNEVYIVSISLEYTETIFVLSWRIFYLTGCVGGSPRYATVFGSISITGIFSSYWKHTGWN